MLSKETKGAYLLLIFISIMCSIIVPSSKGRFLILGIIWTIVLTINGFLGYLLKKEKITPKVYMVIYAIAWIIAAIISLKVTL